MKLPNEAGHFIQIPPLIPIIDGRGHWMTTRVGTYYSKMLGESVNVPMGSINDLASIPPIARPLFPVNGRSRLAAIWHDYGYETGGELPQGKLSRAEVDALFYEMLITTGNDILQGYEGWQLDVLEGCRMYRKMASDKPSLNPRIARMFHAAVNIFGGSRFNNAGSGK